ncbi:MAG: hypothetical protein PHP92_03780 [Candidatus Nanoarchaeia archaeon]|nr:hypothetical protein [Candidatus Nanoarchaeia archaeon]
MIICPICHQEVNVPSQDDLLLCCGTSHLTKQEVEKIEHFDYIFMDEEKRFNNKFTEQ